MQLEPHWCFGTEETRYIFFKEERIAHMHIPVIYWPKATQDAFVDLESSPKLQTTVKSNLLALCEQFRVLAAQLQNNAQHTGSTK